MIIVIDSRQENMVKMAIDSNEVVKIDSLLSNLIDEDAEEVLRSRYSELEYEVIDLADYD